MVNKIAIFILSLLISSIVIADTVAVNPDHPDQYVVKKGDTLWDIAGKFLLEPWRWPDIWHANPQIANPHLIYPGDIVALQYKDGQPIITVSRSGQMASGRTVKLSPRIRSHEKDLAIPAIPIDTIKQFLIRPLVVSKDEMDAWPYVISSFEEHLIAGAGNKIYVRGIPEDNANKRFAVYRRGEPFINPRKDEKEILGYEAIYLGEAIIEKEGDPASAIIAQSYREILEGDRLASESDDDISTNFIPSAPDSDVNGNILSVYDGVAEIGQYQVVVMDLGTNDGMNVGNVLGIFQSGKIVKDKIAAEKKAREECEEDKDFALTNSIHKNKCAFDRTDLVKYLGRPGEKPEEVELPEEYAGVVMIFRTFEKLSYGLVMESISNIHIYDSVRNL